MYHQIVHAQCKSRIWRGHDLKLSCVLESRDHLYWTFLYRIGHMPKLVKMCEILFGEKKNLIISEAKL